MLLQFLVPPSCSVAAHSFRVWSHTSVILGIAVMLFAAQVCKVSWPGFMQDFQEQSLLERNDARLCCLGYMKQWVQQSEIRPAGLSMPVGRRALPWPQRAITDSRWIVQPHCMCTARG